ncbi:uncharacterized protein TrAtP1_001043 [Trichoderma atroviride]|uniref:uncharacterized protein n=1 Tax=Hypocrea atroviridis TaxID=63577 RepID=UPI00331A47D2|nr:hypothetical protein TrAtP1_001043 [Trichoderma atroviride]
MFVYCQPRCSFIIRPPTLAVCIACPCTPLAIPLAMDASPAPRPGHLLLKMFFKINGPGIPGETHYTLPTKTSMSNIVRDGLSLEDVHEVNDFSLSKFRDFAAQYVSPMPHAWIAVAAVAHGSGHVFASGDEDGWFRALDLIAQARMTITDPYHSDVDPAFIAIVPLEQDLPVGVTRHTFEYEHLLLKTKEYICERAPDFFDGDCQLQNLPLPGDLSDEDL